MFKGWGCIGGLCLNDEVYPELEKHTASPHDVFDWKAKFPLMFDKRTGVV